MANGEKERLVQLTEVNSYTQMIGADPDILITEQAPPDNFENIVSVPISAEVASRLFRARKTYSNRCSPF